jgi:hypothetical protein
MVGQSRETGRAVCGSGLAERASFICMTDALIISPLSTASLRILHSRFSRTGKETCGSYLRMALPPSAVSWSHRFEARTAQLGQPNASHANHSR